MSDAQSLHDEEELGKAVDAQLLKRLWPFLRPYSGLFLVDMLLFVPLFAFELAPAWIIKFGLDSVFSQAAEPVVVATAIGGLTAQVSHFLSGILTAPGFFSPLGWLALLYGFTSVFGAGLARKGCLASRRNFRR